MRLITSNGSVRRSRNAPRVLLRRLLHSIKSENTSPTVTVKLSANLGSGNSSFKSSKIIVCSPGKNTKMARSSGSINQPSSEPCVKQNKMFFVTRVWLCPGDKISIVQSGARSNILAISPFSSRTIRDQEKTEISGIIERPSKVQRNSENARAIFFRRRSKFSSAANSV